MVVTGSVLLCEILGLVYVSVIICVSTGIQAVLDFIDKCEDPSLGRELVHQQLQRLNMEDQLTDQCPLMSTEYIEIIHQNVEPMTPI